MCEDEKETRRIFIEEKASLFHFYLFLKFIFIILTVAPSAGHKYKKFMYV